MKHTEHIMGMPVTIICDVDEVDEIFDYFRFIDETYSPYKHDSDVNKVNRGDLQLDDYSDELRDILQLAEQTKQQTNGYFDVWHRGTFDPSGIVKGWAIQHAAELLSQRSQNYYIEAGGDIQVSGHSASGAPWRIGVRNPFQRDEIIAIVNPSNGGIATSGTAVRGQHIYNPHDDSPITDIASVSVIGPHIVDADRYATAAFAMGRPGIHFIESLADYEGYMIDQNGIATMTNRWQQYEVE